MTTTLIKKFFSKVKNGYIILMMKFMKDYKVPVRCLNTSFLLSVDHKKEFVNRVLLQPTAEKVTNYWIEKVIKDGNLVIDIGSNIGFYTILIAKRNPKSTIVAFEPESGNFYKLNKNLVINGIKNVLPYPLAISSTDKIDRFYLSDFQFGAATHALSKPESENRHFKAVHTQGTYCLTLDKFISEFDLKKVKEGVAVKIDVDGSEMEVLNGMYKCVKIISSICVEINWTKYRKEMETFIKKNDFKIIMEEEWKEKHSLIKQLLLFRK